jgi:hypothetical protein
VEALKDKVFVPKKTITVQIDFETWKSFDRLCMAFGLPKTKTFKKLVADAKKELTENGAED